MKAPRRTACTRDAWKVAAVAIAVGAAGAAVPPALAQGTGSAREAPPAACGPVGAIMYDDYEGTLGNLRGLYRSARFAELDAALDCLMKSPRAFRSGRPGSGAVYWMYRRELVAPNLVAADAAAHIQAWRRQRPASIYAEFASLRLMYAAAWQTRGSAFSNKVPEQEMRTFVQGLFATEKALLGASRELRETPIWHNLLLSTVLDSPRPVTDADELLSTVLLRWPKYYDFYEVALSRMIPRWGGSWEAVDRFIVEQSSMRRAAEGDSLYARLYWNVVATGASPQEVLLSWPRMKASLDALIERYPDPVHRNVAASFACVYGDPAYARKIRGQLSPQEVKPSVWIRGTDPASCPG